MSLLSYFLQPFARIPRQFKKLKKFLFKNKRKVAIVLTSLLIVFCLVKFYLAFSGTINFIVGAIFIASFANYRK